MQPNVAEIPSTFVAKFLGLWIEKGKWEICCNFIDLFRNFALCPLYIYLLIGFFAIVTGYFNFFNGVYTYDISLL